MRGFTGVLPVVSEVVFFCLFPHAANVSVAAIIRMEIICFIVFRFYLRGSDFIAVSGGIFDLVEGIQCLPLPG